MALNWTAQRTALEAALTTANAADRPLIREALDGLASKGAAYDALVSSGDLAVSTSTPAEVPAAQLETARLGLLRACARLEFVVASGPARPALVFLHDDVFAPDTFGPGVRASAGVPGDAPGTWRSLVRANIPGAEGNALGVTVAGRIAESSAVVLVTYAARSVETLALGAVEDREVRGAPGRVRVRSFHGRFVSGFVGIMPGDVSAGPLGGGALALSGGSGGAGEWAKLRAELALTAARGAPASAALTLAVDRVQALSALELSGRGAKAESDLASAMLAASELLAYLA